MILYGYFSISHLNFDTIEQILFQENNHSKIGCRFIISLYILISQLCLVQSLRYILRMRPYDVVALRLRRKNIHGYLFLHFLASIQLHYRHRCPIGCRLKIRQRIVNDVRIEQVLERYCRILLIVFDITKYYLVIQYLAEPICLILHDLLSISASVLATADNILLHCFLSLIVGSISHHIGYDVIEVEIVDGA